MATLQRKDFKSDTWGRLVEVLLAREAELLAQLRGLNLDDATSKIVRGRLAEIARTLALDTAPGKPSAASDNDAEDPFARTMTVADQS